MQSSQLGFVLFLVLALCSSEVLAFGSTGTFVRSGSLVGSNYMSTSKKHSQLEMVATAPETEAVLHHVKKMHEDEVAYGNKMFGSDDAKQSPQEGSSWSNEDFISYSVGKGHAGPDENKLHRGDEVFATAEPVFSVEECAKLVAEARATIAEGLKSEERSEQSGRQRTNSELGEAKVSTLPQAREWLKDALREQLFPLLESRFGIAADDLVMYDALIIGYGYFGPARSQPIHRDSSLLSLNVALSPMSDYDGGGTYFEGVEGGPIKIDQGHVICHSGGAMHAGHGISSGERWVLVLFVLARDEPQLARRCHTEGVHLKSSGDLDSSKTAFEAGLSVAPRDHLLNLSVGSIYSAKGDMEKAREYLEITSGLYPLCQKPLIGLGRMLLASGKAQEALSSFDEALARINNSDLVDGAWLPLKAIAWDARVQAAQCAVICAEEEAATVDNTKERSFSLSRLPEAIERINIALVAAPGDPRLVGMLSRAEELLEETSA